MTEGDLEAFVERSRGILDASPDLSARNAELRIVLPLLETLGWEVHGPQLVADHVVERGGDSETAHGDGDGETTRGDERSETADDGADEDEDRIEKGESVTVDFALTVAHEPAVFVVTAGAGEELTGEDGTRLESAMAGGGIDWGIATNARSYVFVAREDGEFSRVRCTLEELPERESILRYYSHEAAAARHRRRAGKTRRAAAERLDDDRDAVVEEIQSALLSAADVDEQSTLDESLPTAVETFVDDLVDALAAGEPPDAALDGGDANGDEPPHADESSAAGSATGSGNGPTGEAGRGGSTGGTATASGAGPAAGERSADRDGGTANERTASGKTASNGDGVPQKAVGADSVDGGSGDESQYIVRFFANASSVGAVGHGTVEGATAQAVEYLVERHALDAGLSLPWSLEDDPRTIINREPVDETGARMDSARQLANGYFLNTDLDAETSRAVVEELANRSGLRVMFQGEW